jgi:hypothetical protein
MLVKKTRCCIFAVQRLTLPPALVRGLAFALCRARKALVCGRDMGRGADRSRAAATPPGDGGGQYDDNKNPV